jgi:hypothetical protein
MVFPLYSGHGLFPNQALDYLLSDAAQAAGSCVVREVSEEGVVGQLLVANGGSRPVLFLEGEELCQGKQNRVLRSSVLVGANSRVAVPVYCTERGRWDRSPTNLTTSSHAPPSLRYLLKQGDRPGGGQTAVWRFIMAKHRATGTHSPRENLSDALRSRREVMDSLRSELRYPEGASGIAVVMRGRTVGIDLFDQPGTLRKLWDRLVILGLTLDAVDVRDDETRDPDLPVRLYKLREARWQQVESVGLGEAFRATGDDGSLAAVLVADGTLLHLSVSVPVYKQGD